VSSSGQITDGLVSPTVIWPFFKPLLWLTDSRVSNLRPDLKVTEQKRDESASNKTRILLVAGARPNFMKVAPILKQLELRSIPTMLVHTGQHYSAELSDTIFRDLALRAPDLNLDVGSGSHAQQTAKVMQAFEPILLDVRPDWVVVVGDVNSTLGCALVTAKLWNETGSRLAHVEAGLRSNDWRMPEEVNRVVTDRLSDLLLTPSRDAKANLLAEGIPEGRISFVGNVMIDTLLTELPRARALAMPSSLGLEGKPYVLVTVHRPSNVDDAANLSAILGGLIEINRVARVVFPIHPRTRKNAEAMGCGELLQQLMTIKPVGYLEMLSLADRASVVMTDSGGLQEETTVLGVPCVTVREQTERPVTISEGTNRMMQWPPTTANLVHSFRSALETGRVPVASRSPDGWDGMASVRIADALSLT
jgi:UDP-N-acetylglucosamine 2-epimerase (non-hydrolysing)